MKVKISKFYNPGQRVDVQIDRWDTYSMDHTLAYIILPMLIQLKATAHGVPGDFADVGGDKHGIQSSFDFYEESHDWAWNTGIKRWDEIMDKMIWSFEQIVDDSWEERYHYGNFDFDFQKDDTKFMNPVTGKLESTSRLVDKNPDGHYFDAIGYQLHQDRIQEGLDLFGKYYRNLWD